MEEKRTGCCQERKKKRAPEDARRLQNRLSRIEGQVRGVRRMIGEDAYCPDVLIQVSAIRSALDSFSRALLSDHIKSCVEEDIRAGRDGAADELVALLQNMLK